MEEFSSKDWNWLTGASPDLMKRLKRQLFMERNNSPVSSERSIPQFVEKPMFVFCVQTVQFLAVVLKNGTMNCLSYSRKTNSN